MGGNQLHSRGGAAGVGGSEHQPAATAVKVDIRDANGLLVRTLDLGARSVGTARFSWDGRTDAGAKAAPGNYTFTARASDGSKEFAADTLMAARVEGVRTENGAVQLVLAGLGSVAYADIKQIL